MLFVTKKCQGCKKFDIYDPKTKLCAQCSLEQKTGKKFNITEWPIYKGKKNSDEILKAKAHSLAELIVKKSVNPVSNLMNEWGSQILNENFAGMVLLRTMYLYICIAQRYAMAHLPKERAMFFSDILANSVMDVFHSNSGSIPSEAKDKLREDFIYKLNIFLAEHSDFRLGGTSHGMKGELLWEFTDYVSSNWLGRGDLAFTMQLWLDLLYNEQEMNIPGLLDGK